MKEKVIDGILHFQVRQNSDFVEGCPAEITRRYLDTRKELVKERRRADDVEARLKWCLQNQPTVGANFLMWDWDAKAGARQFMEIIDGNINAAIDKARVEG